MPWPQFHYSHELVERLLHIERVRSAFELQNPRRQPQTGGDGHALALQRVGGNSTDCPTERTLFELRAALDNERTGYRRGSGLIYNQSRTDLVYVPPEAPDVPELMSGLEHWLAGAWDSVPGVVLAGILEEEILLIQPFERNNGLLARLAGDTVLLRKGYGFAHVHELMAKEPQAYADASHSTHTGVYSEAADLSRWLEYFARQVAAAAEHDAPAESVEQRPAAPPSQTEQESAYAGPVVLRDRQLKALKYIRENGAIRSGEYQRLTGIVPDTARRDFDDLLVKGLIEVHGVGRGTHYLLTRRGADEAERRRVS